MVDSKTSGSSTLPSKAAPPQPAMESQGTAQTASPTKEPKPGLDADSHAAEQQAAQNAEVVDQSYLPTCMAAGVGLDGRFDSATFRVHLDRQLKEAGNPTDPIIRMLVEQFVFAHLRVAALHARAAAAESLEAVKIYSGATARLLAEVRRLGVTLQELRSRAPTAQKVRLSKVG
jgi:hypothetical protein